MTIIPLNDRVLIEPMSKEEKTKSGIYLPYTVDKELPEQGKVLGIGGSVKYQFKKGEQIFFLKYGPTEIEISGKKYLIAKEEDILGIVK